MAKLYFKYGAMGCSKTAQALITKFNYEERGMRVLLLKPAIDTRDGATKVRSRIGLEAEALAVSEDCDLYRLLRGERDTIREYQGEYMSAYAWASATEGRIEAKLRSLTTV